MSKNIVFWSGFAGFCVGILMAINLMVIGLGGRVAYVISLGMVVDALPFWNGWAFIMAPLFTIGVYMVYGVIIGKLISMNYKK